VRLVAQAMGVTVPREAFVSAGDPLGTLPGFYPALIKPNTADGSVGITKDAVVRTEDEARKYLGWLRETLPGRDALYQEYLPGPEYGIGLIGNPDDGLNVLPALEVDFTRLPAGLNPILSFESKAIPDSPYWTEIKFRRAALEPAAEARLGTWAKTLFRRLGLRDYGRFDFRVGADGEPKLMEVNPNPAWANDGKLAFMASFAGIGYPDLLRMILDATRTRIGL
jgi:D-alanine-D-alanine ligase